jgi:hypothetical protein
MNRRGYAVTAGGSHHIGADTASRTAKELASYGWLVEVSLISEREPDLRFFAVGTRDAHEAEEAILRYPGLVREDNRSARRPLSGHEIAYLGLRAGAVRPYMKEAAN